jgi:hypothetical protein
MIHIHYKIVYTIGEKCTEVILTADEYKNIARELLRPVGRSFIPCQLDDVNSTLRSIRNLQLKLDESQVSHKGLKVRYQSINQTENSSLNLNI